MKKKSYSLELQVHFKFRGVFLPFSKKFRNKFSFGAIFEFRSSLTIKPGIRSSVERLMWCLLQEIIRIIVNLKSIGKQCGIMSSVTDCAYFCREIQMPDFTLFRLNCQR